MLMKRLSVAVVLFVAACGGSEDGEVAAEPMAYTDMTFEQRDAFMREVVLPEMTDLFVAFDARFEGMSCQTCHGNGALDGSFAMPTPQIAVLPGEEEFIQRQEDPEYARWSQFMIDQVWPRMADLLQVDMYDPSTNTPGFSCNNCHTVDAAAN